MSLKFYPFNPAIGFDFSAEFSNRHGEIEHALLNIMNTVRDGANSAFFWANGQLQTAIIGLATAQS